MTADLRRLVKKLWRCSKYLSLYTRQRNHKKNGKSTPCGLHFTAVQCLPLQPIVTRGACGCSMGDV